MHNRVHENHPDLHALGSGCPDGAMTAIYAILAPMTYLLAPILGLLIGLLSLTAPVLMLFALPFVKWDKTESFGSYGRDSVMRGDLPDWLGWLRTPDERLPGGLYETEHANLYAKYGKWVASWYWLGVRNRLIGLGAMCGFEAQGYIPDELGFYRAGPVWQMSTKVGVIKFVIGHKVYKLLDGKFRAVPVCSVMLRR